MLRRRYRLLIVSAIVIIIILYRTLQNCWYDQSPRPVAVAPLQPLSYDKLASPAHEKIPSGDNEEDQPKANQVTKEVKDGYLDMDEIRQYGPAEAESSADEIQSQEPNHEVDANSDSILTPNTNTSTDGPGDVLLKQPSDDSTGDDRQTTVQISKPTSAHRTRHREHFPVPKESIITLPTATPKKIPRIQHIFPVEADVAKKKRLKRQAAVKEAIQRSWAGYREYAWLHDELSPVSNRSRDPFCGWAATMVDSLDTLWIAGLKEEFNEAANATKFIDFTYTSRPEIPVFETTIRYLGGLIAAYDVSGGALGQHSFLLDKAVELAEILMGIFDTPNRMPLLSYPWRPESTMQPRRAGRAGIAELATLSLEFTRLAQLTSQHKYYDAVDRITNGLIEMQQRGTLMPGLFPENLDISGCNSTATNHPNAISKAAKAKAPLEANKGNYEWDCVPQGFVPEGSGETYHIGGGQDSAYEYFGKEYLLLGGREPKYQKLYEDAVEGINKHLLFRPMVEGDWDIIFPAKIGLKSSGEIVNAEYEVAHLTCFIGGMYALGGKLFSRERDLSYAMKFTDGCVWAYQSTATGIMPEGAEVVPCPSFDKCSFNETTWWQALDPIYESRNKQVREWEQDQLELQRFNKREDERRKEEVKGGTKTTTAGAIEKAPGGDSSQNQIYGAAISLNTAKAVPKQGYHSRPDLPRMPEERQHSSRSSLKPISHEEYVQDKIKGGIPPGYRSVSFPKYILRPEAIESVWYMYRITGDPNWMEKGWTMFEATMKATRTSQANSAIDNVLRKDHSLLDEMESFWLSETLKYYYLLFSSPNVISLDEWVLNTEAHPLKLQTGDFKV